MIVVVYFEGRGFIEYKKVFSSLLEAMKIEGDKILDAHVYKNGKKLFLSK